MDTSGFDYLAWHAMWSVFDLKVIPEYRHGLKDSWFGAITDSTDPTDEIRLRSSPSLPLQNPCPRSYLKQEEARSAVFEFPFFSAFPLPASSTDTQPTLFSLAGAGQRGSAAVLIPSLWRLQRRGMLGGGIGVP
ncbi:hypothetical protein SLEP1_g3672 [Rubroshorea leprosula]|uniref:Uncharacterized protein n=1 Tax=Rubroshorea leprosula TaxID=152421 RepID=A0AAV5HQH6_9ROSI|nr:hypothetical protein SLEP1_g3672 [Rubroshorea leprosula]